MRIGPAGMTAAAALAAAVIAGCGSGGSTQTSSPAAAPATQSVTREVTTADSTSSASGSTTSAAGTASTTSPRIAGPPPCRAAGLALSYLGGQGATGHGLLGFALRNTGTAACSSIGYPGVLLRSASGSPLPTHPQHTTSDFFGKTVYKSLMVAPGASISFRLGVSHGAASPSGCRTAGSVQVIAPNDTATMRVRIPGGVYECGGTVTVSPVQAGDSAFSAQ